MKIIRLKICMQRTEQNSNKKVCATTKEVHKHLKPLDLEVHKLRSKFKLQQKAPKHNTENIKI